MDRTTLEDHLRLAEEHVAKGERLVDRQRRLIADMARDGHNTDEALRLLGTLEKTQALHLADRERLRAELAASGGSDRN